MAEYSGFGMGSAVGCRRLEGIRLKSRSLQTPLGGLTLAFDPLQLFELEPVGQVSMVFSHSKCSSFFRPPRRCSHRYRLNTQ